MKGDQAVANKTKPGLAELTNMANDYAKGVLSRVGFPLPPDMDEAAFADCMNVIVQQLVSAWAAGYAKGVER